MNYYSDVYIIPQYSEVRSRKHVDTSIKLGDLKLDVPVISANMDTVTGSDLAIAMVKGGGVGALHRFQSIEENVEDFKKVDKLGYPCFVSIGVGEEAVKRSKALFDAGARYFIIDIAHGDSILMKEMLEYLRKLYEHKIYIMAGNVATSGGVINLDWWEADTIKVNIAPGSVCQTKNVTGVTIPPFKAINDCKLVSRLPLVSDGGFVEYGDVCKAIGAGASCVMSGKFFAGCIEAAGERADGKKFYRGSASSDVMKIVKREEDMTTPEGISTVIFETDKSAVDILKEIKGALQSSMSYSNAHNIAEFQERVKFGYK